jgi:hypothetical protein
VAYTWCNIVKFGRRPTEIYFGNYSGQKLIK